MIKLKGYTQLIQCVNRLYYHYVCAQYHQKTYLTMNVTVSVWISIVKMLTFWYICKLLPEQIDSNDWYSNRYTNIHGQRCFLMTLCTHNDNIIDWHIELIVYPFNFMILEWILLKRF